MDRAEEPEATCRAWGKRGLGPSYLVGVALSQFHFSRLGQTQPDPLGMGRISSFELMGKDWKQVIVEQYVCLVSVRHRCPSALKSLPRKDVVTPSRGPFTAGAAQGKKDAGQLPENQKGGK